MGDPWSIPRRASLSKRSRSCTVLGTPERRCLAQTLLAFRSTRYPHLRCLREHSLQPAPLAACFARNAKRDQLKNPRKVRIVVLVCPLNSPSQTVSHLNSFNGYRSRRGAAAWAGPLGSIFRAHFAIRSIGAFLSHTGSIWASWIARWASLTASTIFSVGHFPTERARFRRASMRSSPLAMGC